MLLEKYIGRRLEHITISENKDIDMTDVVSIKAELVTATPVVVNNEKLNEVEDTYCEHSQWPYVKGTVFGVVFDDTNTTKVLKVTLVKLVVNPNWCE